MAQAVRDIRRRIKAIRSTQQITRAMQMVAAARLRKAQTRALSARAYAAKLDELLGRLVEDGAHAGHPLLARRPVRKATLVVITSDRGLAGSYNTNLFRRTEAVLGELKAGGAGVSASAAGAGASGTGGAGASGARGADVRGPEVELLVVGRKGRDYFRRRQWTIAREDLAVPDDALAGLAADLATGLIDRFSRGATDEVIVIYSKFVSTLQQKPVAVRLLPVTADEAAPVETSVGRSAADEATPGGAAADEAPAGGAAADRQPRDSAEDLHYVYEPDARAVFALLLPRYVSSQLHQALLEARASQYAAQMTAMAAATDNAEELVSKLTLEMHRARQANITQEIMELVGGAEALKEK